ncbi:MAG: serine protease [Planctomycetota bacterium]|nr:MAG: serine protease [Planctomycetota bacterium]
MLRAMRWPAALLLAAAPAAAQGPTDARPLAPNTPLSVAIPAVAAAATVFKIDVPDDATGLWLQALGADIDIEIDAAYEAPPDSADALVSSNLWIDEQLLIERGNGVPLQTGAWYVRVHGVEAGGDGPREGTCTLLARLIRPEPRPLAANALVELELARDQGLRAVLLPSLPADARGPWIVEAFSPLADIDLVIGPADPRRTLQAPLGRSERMFSYEALRIDAQLLAAGLALHVYAHSDLESVDAIPVRVALRSVDSAGPRALVEAPLPNAAALGPFGAPIAATVALFGPLGSGSGVVVDARGRILTNAHVVSGARGGAALDLAVGFTSDPALPPIPCFAAELLEFRPDLDLALLGIRGWIDGRPFASAPAFPACKLREGAAPALGERLIVLGYPMTGGASSMVPISLTEGVMSGWSQDSVGRLVKTDAAIHAGVSGGACLDAAGALVGLPSSSLADANQAGGLGFVIPLERLPAVWRAAPAESRPR